VTYLRWISTHKGFATGFSRPA